MTGNDARVLEIGEQEMGARRVASVLKDVLHDGVPLVGSKRELLRLVGTREPI